MNRMLRPGHQCLAKKSSSEPTHGVKRHTSMSSGESKTSTSLDKKQDEWLRVPTGKRSSVDDPTSDDFARTMWASFGWGAGMAIVSAVVYRVLFGG